MWQMHRCRVITAVLFLTGVFAGLSDFDLAYGGDGNCGQVESAKGRVEILRLKGAGGQANEIRQVVLVKGRTRVSCQDVIVTGASSRAKVRLGGQVLLTLGAHSRIAIEDYLKSSGNPTLLHLTYGKVRALFQRAGKEKPDTDEKAQGTSDSARNREQFRIRTSTAVAGVRGTDFYLSYEPNTKITEQATLAGQVKVQQVGSEQEVLVDAGKQVVVNQVPKEVETLKSESSQKETLKPPLRPLSVVPITTSVVAEIKQTSFLVKDDKEFISTDSVKVLGPPKDWTPPVDEVPFDLKDLKEEF